MNEDKQETNWKDNYTTTGEITDGRYYLLEEEGERFNFLTELVTQGRMTIEEKISKFAQRPPVMYRLTSEGLEDKSIEQIEEIDNQQVVLWKSELMTSKESPVSLEETESEISQEQTIAYEDDKEDNKEDDKEDKRAAQIKEHTNTALRNKLPEFQAAKHQTSTTINETDEYIEIINRVRIYK